MKLLKKTWIFVLLITIALFVVSVVVDRYTMENGEKPLFALSVKMMEDGGTQVYQGTFYQITNLHRISDVGSDYTHYQTGWSMKTGYHQSIFFSSNFTDVSKNFTVIFLFVPLVIILICLFHQIRYRYFPSLISFLINLIIIWFYIPYFRLGYLIVNLVQFLITTALFWMLNKFFPRNKQQSS